MNAKYITSKLTAAFSLIELMVVIAIVALLTAIAVPSYQQYLQQAKVTEIFSLASDQMNQWEENYNLGTSFDLAFPSPSGTMGNYITTVEIASGGTIGTPTNGGTKVTSCPANGVGGSLGVVCIQLNSAAGTGINSALSGLMIIFTPSSSGSSTDTSQQSIVWTCNYYASADNTTIDTLLAPGNCTYGE